MKFFFESDFGQLCLFLILFSRRVSPSIGSRFLVIETYKKRDFSRDPFWFRIPKAKPFESCTFNCFLIWKKAGTSSAFFQIKKPDRSCNQALLS